MRGLGLALAALLAAPAVAAPPPLVVVVTVDGLSGDLFDEYRPSFTGGLARLARGTMFRNAYQGQSGGPTLGTMLKRVSPDSQNLAVSGAQPSATALGELVDQRWYWTGGRFASDAARPPLLRSPALASAGVARMVASPEGPLQPPPVCQTKAGGPTAGVGNRFARSAGDYAGFTASPALDGATLALAAGLIGELGLGRDRAPDVISVKLASTGNVHSRFGASGEEACLQLLSLDRDLAGFFDALDRAGLHYAVALSGGGSERSRVPILLWRAGMVPTERVEAIGTVDILPTLGAMLGIPLSAGTNGKCLPGVNGVDCSRP
jgi:hypothetical protein